MSNAFFYVFIYFLGYYGSNVLNMLTVRPIITNRFVAALIPVYGFAFTHTYMIVNKAPPPGITIESTIFFSVITPLVLITVGAIYFMWRSKDRQDAELDQTAQSSIDQRITESTEAHIAEIPEQKAQASEKPELSGTKPLQDSNKTRH
ncbi:hypothetical protein W03_17700 [Nitrosomonas sp. PY1]|uniref:hypothetical protein n=1 Tax=Nitrosomonas sp. PY1 TaxID=1803906 RepID=UPI001FC7F680|nr:hypothetical protein [Nitrosomonas sp. PY1]GKS69766.1 hypothetical protein W03_17700 [Nitrosomonas sp. PY1]